LPETSITTDYLTSLPNARSLFMTLDHELSRSQREGTSLAVVVCDLDGFKQVNDRFGHLTGNKILRLVALGLREQCKERDYVARMGGDEFVMLIPGGDPDALDEKIEGLRNVAHQAGGATPEPCSLSLSIGIAIYPEDGSDAEELLAESDRRMYKSKRLRKKSVGLPLSAPADPVVTAAVL
jgi:diguanylate cyclase (GGDEF)-like protein